jgi:hypothetical protein
MSRYLPLQLIAWTGLLFLVACRPAGPSPAEPRTPPATTPSPTPSGDGVANADVLHVKAVQATDGTWTFHVTVRHPDTGWEDYADGWDVVAVPPDVAQVHVRAHDLVDGYGGREVVVDLTTPSGPDFEVVRQP